MEKNKHEPEIQENQKKTGAMTTNTNSRRQETTTVINKTMNDSLQSKEI